MAYSVLLHCEINHPKLSALKQLFCFVLYFEDQEWGRFGWIGISDPHGISWDSWAWRGFISKMAFALTHLVSLSPWSILLPCGVSSSRASPGEMNLLKDKVQLSKF